MWQTSLFITSEALRRGVLVEPIFFWKSWKEAFQRMFSEIFASESFSPLSYNDLKTTNFQQKSVFLISVPSAYWVSRWVSFILIKSNRFIASPLNGFWSTIDYFSSWLQQERLQKNTNLSVFCSFNVVKAGKRPGWFKKLDNSFLEYKYTKLCNQGSNACLDQAC